MNILEQIKSKKYVIAGALVLAIAVLAAAVFTTVKTYAEEEYWAVQIGSKTACVLNSESSAKKVIKNVKNHYTAEGAKVKAISCDPAMKVVKKTYKASKRPKVSTVDDAVNYILTGTKKRLTYTVKSGDSPWTIAAKYDLSVREILNMNEEKDFSTLYPGDKLKLYRMNPMVTVTATQQITSEETIEYETVTKESSEVLKNTTVVEQKGSNGKRQVTKVITTENGKTVKSKVEESKVIKSPQKRIVVKGTGILPAPTGGKTYQGDGQAVAQYALKFVGGPYVYGGVSLTDGADCSGFVLSVYKYFGITMAHDAGVMRSYGREVSLAEAQPGDLVCYYGHVGIYIGGGQIVHAVNERMGIAVTGTGYIGPVMTVRRIVE